MRGVSLGGVSALGPSRASFSRAADVVSPFSKSVLSRDASSSNVTLCSSICASLFSASKSSFFFPIFHRSPFSSSSFFFLPNSFLLLSVNLPLLHFLVNRHHNS